VRPTRLTDTLGFRTEKFLPQLVYGSEGIRVFLLCLEPGQGLSPRADPEELLCYLIQGRAKLTLGDEVMSVSAGDLAAAAPGQVRGIEAEERSVALWVHAAEGRSRDG
jgi:quercetin dioxygenase-like cupin family protein